MARILKSCLSLGLIQSISRVHKDISLSQDIHIFKLIKAGLSYRSIKYMLSYSEPILMITHNIPYLMNAHNVVHSMPHDMVK